MEDPLRHQLVKLGVALQKAKMIDGISSDEPGQSHLYASQRIMEGKTVTEKRLMHEQGRKAANDRYRRDHSHGNGTVRQDNINGLDHGHVVTANNQYGNLIDVRSILTPRGHIPCPTDSRGINSLNVEGNSYHAHSGAGLKGAFYLAGNATAPVPVSIDQNQNFVPVQLPDAVQHESSINAAKKNGTRKLNRLSGARSGSNQGTDIQPILAHLDRLSSAGRSLLDSFNKVKADNLSAASSDASGSTGHRRHMSRPNPVVVPQLTLNREEIGVQTSERQNLSVDKRHGAPATNVPTAMPVNPAKVFKRPRPLSGDDRRIRRIKHNVEKLDFRGLVSDSDGETRGGGCLEITPPRKRKNIPPPAVQKEPLNDQFVPQSQRSHYSTSTVVDDHPISLSTHRYEVERHHIDSQAKQFEREQSEQFASYHHSQSTTISETLRSSSTADPTSKQSTSGEYVMNALANCQPQSHSGRHMEVMSSQRRSVQSKDSPTNTDKKHRLPDNTINATKHDKEELRRYMRQQRASRLKQKQAAEEKREERSKKDRHYDTAEVATYMRQRRHSERKARQAVLERQHAELQRKQASIEAVIAQQRGRANIPIDRQLLDMLHPPEPRMERHICPRGEHRVDTESIRQKHQTPSLADILIGTKNLAPQFQFPVNTAQPNASERSTSSLTSLSDIKTNLYAEHIVTAPNVVPQIQHHPIAHSSNHPVITIPIPTNISRNEIPVQPACDAMTAGDDRDPHSAISTILKRNPELRVYSEVEIREMLEGRKELPRDTKNRLPGGFSSNAAPPRLSLGTKYNDHPDSQTESVMADTSTMSSVLSSDVLHSMDLSLNLVDPRRRQSTPFSSPLKTPGVQNDGSVGVNASPIMHPERERPPNISFLVDLVHSERATESERRHGRHRRSFQPQMVPDVVATTNNAIDTSLSPSTSGTTAQLQEAFADRRSPPGLNGRNHNQQPVQVQDDVQLNSPPPPRVPPVVLSEQLTAGLEYVRNAEELLKRIQDVDSQQQVIQIQNEAFANENLLMAERASNQVKRAAQQSRNEVTQHSLQVETAQRFESHLTNMNMALVQQLATIGQHAQAQPVNVEQLTVAATSAALAVVEAMELRRSGGVERRRSSSRQSNHESENTSSRHDVTSPSVSTTENSRQQTEANVEVESSTSRAPRSANDKTSRSNGVSFVDNHENNASSSPEIYTENVPSIVESYISSEIAEVSSVADVITDQPGTVLSVSGGSYTPGTFVTARSSDMSEIAEVASHSVNGLPSDRLNGSSAAVEISSRTASKFDEQVISIASVPTEVASMNGMTVGSTSVATVLSEHLTNTKKSSVSIRTVTEGTGGTRHHQSSYSADFENGLNSTNGGTGGNASRQFESDESDDSTSDTISTQENSASVSNATESWKMEKSTFDKETVMNARKLMKEAARHERVSALHQAQLQALKENMEAQVALLHVRNRHRELEGGNNSASRGGNSITHLERQIVDNYRSRRLEFNNALPELHNQPVAVEQQQSAVNQLNSQTLAICSQLDSLMGNDVSDDVRPPPVVVDDALGYLRQLTSSQFVEAQRSRLASRKQFADKLIETRQLLLEEEAQVRRREHDAVRSWISRPFKSELPTTTINAVASSKPKQRQRKKSDKSPVSPTPQSVISTSSRSHTSDTLDKSSTSTASQSTLSERKSKKSTKSKSTSNVKSVSASQSSRSSTPIMKLNSEIIESVSVVEEVNTDRESTASPQMQLNSTSVRTPSEVIHTAYDESGVDALSVAEDSSAIKTDIGSASPESIKSITEEVESKSNSASMAEDINEQPSVSSSIKTAKTSKTKSSSKSKTLTESYNYTMPSSEELSSANSVSTVKNAKKSEKSDKPTKSVVKPEKKSDRLNNSTVPVLRLSQLTFEDSFSFSLSESSNEARLQALRDQLKQRREVAEKLKRDYKSRSIERIEQAEKSIKRQIEAYDTFIQQTKEHLDETQTRISLGGFEEAQSPRIVATGSQSTSRPASPIKQHRRSRKASPEVSPRLVDGVKMSLSRSASVSRTSSPTKTSPRRKASQRTTSTDSSDRHRSDPSVLTATLKSRSEDAVPTKSLHESVEDNAYSVSSEIKEDAPVDSQSSEVKTAQDDSVSDPISESKSMVMDLGPPVAEQQVENELVVGDELEEESIKQIASDKLDELIGEEVSDDSVVNSVSLGLGLDDEASQKSASRHSESKNIVEPEIKSDSVAKSDSVKEFQSPVEVKDQLLESTKDVIDEEQHQDDVESLVGTVDEVSDVPEDIVSEDEDLTPKLTERSTFHDIPNLDDTMTPADNYIERATENDEETSSDAMADRIINTQFPNLLDLVIKDCLQVIGEKEDARTAVFVEEAPVVVTTADVEPKTEIKATLESWTEPVPEMSMHSADVTEEQIGSLLDEHVDDSVVKNIDLNDQQEESPRSIVVSPKETMDSNVVESDEAIVESDDVIADRMSNWIMSELINAEITYAMAIAVKSPLLSPLRNDASPRDTSVIKQSDYQKVMQLARESLVKQLSDDNSSDGGSPRISPRIDASSKYDTVSPRKFEKPGEKPLNNVAFGSLVLDDVVDIEGDDELGWMDDDLAPVSPKKENGASKSQRSLNFSLGASFFAVPNARDQVYKIVDGLVDKCLEHASDGAHIEIDDMELQALGGKRQTSVDLSLSFTQKSDIAYRRFLLDLTSDLVKTALVHCDWLSSSESGKKLSQVAGEERYCWQRPKRLKLDSMTKNARGVRNVEELKSLVQGEIADKLKLQVEKCQRQSRRSQTVCRKKLDFVDKQLVDELYEEEPDWTVYDNEETMVKLKIADEIFKLILDDTVNIATTG